MAEKKKLTVAEILAAARKTDSKQGAAPAGEAAAAPPEGTAAQASGAPEAAPAPPAEIAASSEPAETTPAAPAKPASGARPSVAEMLAMARANKGGGAAKPAAAESKPAAPKPTPKPAAEKTEKPAAAKPAKASPADVKRPIRDTASILAAARQGAKAGPLSKSEAAAQPKPKPAPAAKTKPAAKPAVKKAPVVPAAFRDKAAKGAKPAKPAKEEEQAEDRRSFFGSFAGIGFTTLTATFALWTLGTARFMFPNVLTEPPSRFKVGPPANFPPGQVETKFVAQFGVWIINGEYKGQRQIYALKTVCTHLGCTPNWLEGEQKFKCPCHGSGFYKDGINFEGPAPRPLERYAIEVDGGQLQIDKSKTFQEEVGQWADPTSFVNV